MPSDWWPTRLRSTPRAAAWRTGIERRLSQRLGRLLKNGSQTALDAALEHLFKHNADASDVLAEQAETLAGIRHGRD